MRMIIPRKVLFLPNQLADKEHACMRESWDISLIFNEFKDAPLWFLYNYVLWTLNSFFFFEGESIHWVIFFRYLTILHDPGGGGSVRDDSARPSWRDPKKCCVFFLEKRMSANLVSLSESGKFLWNLEKTCSCNLRNEPLNTVKYSSVQIRLQDH